MAGERSVTLRDRKKSGIDTGGQCMGRTSDLIFWLQRKSHSFPTVCTVLKYNFGKIKCFSNSKILS